MASVKRKLKSIKYLCRYDIKGVFYGRSKIQDYCYREYVKEKEQFDFKYISKHAQKRLNERFAFRGYTIEDVRKDIKHYQKRERQKHGCTKVTGKLGTYIISNGAKVLVTVI